MATLAPISLAHGGSTVTYAAASVGGDKAQTGSSFVLLVKNTDASAHTVTLVTTGTVDGLAIADRAITVGAGLVVAIPLLDLYTDPTTNLASWTYDAVTSVSVAVLYTGS